MYNVHFVEANSFDYISWVKAEYDVVFALRGTGKICIFVLNKVLSIDSLKALLKEHDIYLRTYGDNFLEGFLNCPFEDLKKIVSVWNV